MNDRGRATTLKRMRLLCNFTQALLGFATGVPVSRISAMETGRAEMREQEWNTLENFLVERWQATVERERESPFARRAADISASLVLSEGPQEVTAEPAAAQGKAQEARAEV
jgi:hypothetical protein